LQAVEALRGSGAAPAGEHAGPGMEDPGVEATPALIDDLRTRMDEVRARLSGLAVVAEADGRPGAETVTVPADLLERLHEEIVATRALIAGAVAALGESEEPGPRDAGSPERNTACAVAWNMALNGAPRAEVDRYLADNFDLPNAHLIVAEAFAHPGATR
jgi:hypothetical protein